MKDSKPFPTIPTNLMSDGVMGAHWFCRLCVVLAAFNSLCGNMSSLRPSRSRGERGSPPARCPWMFTNVNKAWQRSS